MKFIKTVLILSFLALFVFACSQATNTNNIVDKKNATPITRTVNPTPDELADARTLYTEKCMKCHKEDGTGGISTVDGKKIKAANFSSNALKKESDEDLVEEIKVGVEDEGMPSFAKELSEEQIKSLVKFIRKEFQAK
jgi:mono/diheme cytochrome c family protein